MHEILGHLPKGARVLDLGSAGGSFPAVLSKALTVRVDSNPPNSQTDAPTVLGDAASLPFRSAVFDGIICNHSLEHFHDLNHSLEEIGRALKDGGSLFISVPDAGTLCDRIYRWLAQGGGHVNAFRSAEELAEMVSRIAGVPHTATRTLCTSFSFLNRKNPHPQQPRRIALFLWGSEPFLIAFNILLRLYDRLFQGRASVYGWAIYFGPIKEPISRNASINVCVRCGQGHPSSWLASIGAVRAYPPFSYRCPTCRTLNFFFRDECYDHLRHSPSVSRSKAGQ